MAEDVFYASFRNALGETLDSLGDGPELRRFPFKGLYLNCWNSSSEVSKTEGIVIACDGSLGRGEYSGGLCAWYARALAHIYDRKNILRPLPKVSVRVGHGLRGSGYNLKALELSALKEAVEEAPKARRPIIALYDGTLYPLMPPFPHRIKEEAEQIFAYIKALRSLLETCSKHEVLLFGVSKDSNVNYLRVRLLLQALVEVGIGLGRERSLKRVIAALRKRAKDLEDNAKAQVEAILRELETPTSDEETYEMVTETPGHTTPLALAPQVLYFGEEIKNRTKNWWDSKFRERLSSSPSLKPLAEELDALFNLPPIFMFYWRPHHGLAVHRVDVPSLSWKEVRWGDISGDTLINGDDIRKTMMHLVSILNSLSPEPYVAKPILEVDTAVRMEKGVFSKIYEPIIQSELRKRGFRAKLKRRKVRDIMRGLV